MYRILERLGNRVRWGKDREGESSRSSRLASIEESKEYVKVFGIGKLL